MTLVKFNRNNYSHPVFPRFFNDFFNEELDFYTPRQSKFVPAVNVIEEEKEFKIEVAAPGLNKKDFKVNLDKDVLTIEANKEENKDEKKKNYTRKEFCNHSFSRSFKLPDTIDGNSIDAKYEDGILHVMLPKKEEAILPAREIKIS